MFQRRLLALRNRYLKGDWSVVEQILALVLQLSSEVCYQVILPWKLFVEFKVVDHVSWPYSWLCLVGTKDLVCLVSKLAHTWLQLAKVWFNAYRTPFEMNLKWWMCSLIAMVHNVSSHELSWNRRRIFGRCKQSLAWLFDTKVGHVIPVCRSTCIIHHSLHQVLIVSLRYCKRKRVLRTSHTSFKLSLWSDTLTKPSKWTVLLHFTILTHFNISQCFRYHWKRVWSLLGN